MLISKRSWALNTSSQFYITAYVGLKSCTIMAWFIEISNRLTCFLTKIARSSMPTMGLQEATIVNHPRDKWVHMLSQELSGHPRLHYNRATLKLQMFGVLAAVYMNLWMLWPIPKTIIAHSMVVTLITRYHQSWMKKIFSFRTKT